MPEDLVVEYYDYDIVVGEYIRYQYINGEIFELTDKGRIQVIIH